MIIKMNTTILDVIHTEIDIRQNIQYKHVIRYNEIIDD